MNALPTSLDHLLKAVSRTFYQTMRILPGAVRGQIGLAYLLARATDTIADTELVPIAERLDSLQSLRQRILGQRQEPLDFGQLARRQGENSRSQSIATERSKGAASEQILIERIEEILGILRDFSLPDQKLIRDVLEIITSGQELDLKRFGGASMRTIVALPNEADLDDYTWRVAGCVGEFWTKICRAHLFPEAPLNDVTLIAQGVRFGKGLQLVNILRDLPSDLRQGRCYIPATLLHARRSEAADLLQPAHEPRFRPLYASLLDQAEAHLAAGWVYTNTLPRGCVRVRLACAWPILIGAKTLGRLRAENVLEPSRRIKITRRDVRFLVAKSVLVYPWDWAWQRLFAQAGRA